MASILDYKEKLENGDNKLILQIIQEIKNDKTISYFDRQKLLYFGYYKIDYFEDALKYLRKVVDYCRFVLGQKEIDLSKLLQMSIGDFFTAFFLEDGEGAACGSCCCNICCCCMLCDCNCGKGTFIDNFAQKFDCCVIRDGLPACQDIIVKLFVGIMDVCFTMPLECCTDCLF